MISNPKYGWCAFNIEGFHGHPSYLTDVPVELLECFVSFFKTGTSSCFFDEEGTDFILVFTQTSSFIMASEEEEPKLYEIKTPAIDLAKELLNDIKQFKEDWIEWSNPDDDDLTEREKCIDHLCEELQILIKYLSLQNKITEEHE